jgi:hypothetical protein
VLCFFLGVGGVAVKKKLSFVEKLRNEKVAHCAAPFEKRGSTLVKMILFVSFQADKSTSGAAQHT